MPTELLLPAFALTLLANAALVAVAIQWLLRARAERDDPSPPNRQRKADRAASEPEDPAVAPITATPTRPDPVAPEPTSDVGAPPASEPSKPPRRPRATATRPVAPKPVAPKPARAPKPAAAAKARAAKPASSRSVGPLEPTTRRGGRRRFSLPPLDDDHERVNRSIETFLTGSEGSDATDTGSASTPGATTVAMVAIDGLDPDGDPADRRAADAVVSAVEKTLRGAARSADRVTSLGNGRFRVVLAATGELAARAYLRRIRTTVGPSLESLDLPLDLVTATATVLDDTVPIAIAQAEARLDAALATAARRASDDEPRAAPR